MLAVSQPQAGAFLNAVPKYEPFRIQTWALQIAVQKRLAGLPLLAAGASLVLAGAAVDRGEHDRYPVTSTPGDGCSVVHMSPGPHTTPNTPKHPTRTGARLEIFGDASDDEI